jgi:hypothetical protein
MTPDQIMQGAKTGISFWQKMREVSELLSPDGVRFFMLVQCTSPDSMLLAEKSEDDRDLTFAVILDLIPDEDEEKAVRKIRALRLEIRGAIESWNLAHGVLT